LHHELLLILILILDLLLVVMATVWLLFVATFASVVTKLAEFVVGPVFELAWEVVLVLVLVLVLALHFEKEIVFVLVVEEVNLN
jgi:membrane protein implicated in regulation of membrane protease activity